MPCSRIFPNRSGYIRERRQGKAFLFFASLFLCFSIRSAAQENRFSFTEPKMGAPFTIVMYANDSTQAAGLAKECFRLVDSFNLIFSDYIDTSELSKLSASAGINARAVSVSPDLLDILLAAKKAFDKSDGAFDITIGPLSKFWRKARKAKKFPANEEIQPVRSLVGFNNMVIDTANKKVTMSRAGMQLDLGGIAQGWIGQKVIDFLRGRQIDHALVNVSGDVIMSGAPPGSKGWTIGVNVPETKDDLLPRTLLMQNKSVTTSGDAYQYIDHAGKRYSHIIDPRSGYGVTFQRNVTAIADDGTTADWLATACSILPVKKAKKLAQQLGAEVLIAEFKKGKLVFYATPGFGLYWKQQQQ